MAPRRRSLASPDDSLFHVGQRLDALAADDDHAVFYFSRVATPVATRSRSRRGLRSSSAYPPHAATTTSRRRRRPRRLLGLSPFYARAALLAGASWAVAAFGVVATTAAMGATPPSLRHASTDRQTAHELASLSAGAALGGVLGGSLGDHYGRRPLLLAATLGGALAVVLAGAVAWCHAALLVARVGQGLSLGAQIVLFPIALGELAAQRRRGRVIVAALAGLPLGALLAVHTAKRLAAALGWRVLTAALLGVAQSFVVAALLGLQRESPRFLAAIGRVETALAIVEQVERAHGVDRNARVTMPSTLFAPPVSIDREPEGAVESPWPLASTGTPTMPLPRTRGRRTSAALTPRTVSLFVSLRKRWNRVLFCAPYARRSLGLVLLWVLVAGGLSTTVGAASRFTKEALVAAPRLLSTYVAGAGALGLLTSAVAVDRCGRVPLFLLSLLVSSLATTLVGFQLYMALDATALLAVACALLALAAVVALGAAVLWTLESYGVLIRATGMGLAFTGMACGVGAGQWLAWSPWLSATSAPFALWGVAAAFIGLAFCTWLWGVETRGLEDVDAVIMAPEPDPLAMSSSGSSGGDKLPSLQHQLQHFQQQRERERRSFRTYHSKGTTQDSHEDDDRYAVADDCHETETARQQRQQRTTSRRQGPTGASANSDASTLIGSSRTSSARFSSVRFSQRTLSSGPMTSGTRSRSRSSSFTRSHHQLRHGTTPVSSSHRHLSRGDQTPPFVIRRSSLSSQSRVAYATYGQSHSDSYVPRSHSRRRSRTDSGNSQYRSRERDEPWERPRRLPTPPSARLDPHSVRELSGHRRSDSDGSRSDGLGDHDVLSIDIDPFEDDDERRHGGLPILG